MECSEQCRSLKQCLKLQVIPKIVIICRGPPGFSWNRFANLAIAKRYKPRSHLIYHTVHRPQDCLYSRFIHIFTRILGSFLEVPRERTMALHTLCEGPRISQLNQHTALTCLSLSEMGLFPSSALCAVTALTSLSKLRLQSDLLTGPRGLQNIHCAFPELTDLDLSWCRSVPHPTFDSITCF